MSKCNAFRKVTHVIFDLDGVLLDTEVMYRNVITNIAKQFGKVYTPEIQSKLVGTPERDSCRIAVTEMKLPISVDEFQHKFSTNSRKYLKNSALMSGADMLIRHFHHHSVPIAIATSSAQSSFDLKVSMHKDLFKLFNHVVCGGTDPEVKRGKPNPDIFLVCASRFPDNPKPERCLVFEDSPNGVQAAKSAGMQVVMIPDENVSLELQKDASIRVGSLEEVPLEMFGLPALK